MLTTPSSQTDFAVRKTPRTLIDADQTFLTDYAVRKTPRTLIDADQTFLTDYAVRKTCGH